MRGVRFVWKLVPPGGLDYCPVFLAAFAGKALSVETCYYKFRLAFELWGRDQWSEKAWAVLGMCASCVRALPQVLRAEGDTLCVQIHMNKFGRNSHLPERWCEQESGKWEKSRPGANKARVRQVGMEM